MKLVIGNKNYSTWSLRPWLLLSAFDVEFDEVNESLVNEGLSERLAKHSPTCRVPVLLDNELTVWDSLAICEYVNEEYLNGKAWPANLKLRAQARAVCSEMHAGFSALRNELPMNCRAIRKVEISAAAKVDIARVDSIWSDCLDKNSASGPWLFGDFSIADCFYAPVVLRFVTYEINLSEPAQRYADTLLKHASVLAWVAAGKKETEIVVEDEAGV